MDVEVLSGMLKGINTALLGIIEAHPDKEFVTSFLKAVYGSELEEELSDGFRLGYEISLGDLIKSLDNMQAADK